VKINSWKPPDLSPCLHPLIFFSPRHFSSPPDILKCLPDILADIFDAPLQQKVLFYYRIFPKCRPTLGRHLKCRPADIFQKKCLGVKHVFSIWGCTSPSNRQIRCLPAMKRTFSSIFHRPQSEARRSAYIASCHPQEDNSLRSQIYCN